VRDFYEHTARYTVDVWSETYFPTRIGLWLLVKTSSRQVNQRNFPLTPLETAHGMLSEIWQLRRADGSIRYTGWFRTLGEVSQVLYTGSRGSHGKASLLGVRAGLLPLRQQGADV